MLSANYNSLTILLFYEALTFMYITQAHRTASYRTYMGKEIKAHHGTKHHETLLCLDGSSARLHARVLVRICT